MYLGLSLEKLLRQKWTVGLGGEKMFVRPSCVGQARRHGKGALYQADLYGVMEISLTKQNKLLSFQSWWKNWLQFGDAKGTSSKVWYLVFTCFHCLPLRKKSIFLFLPCDIGGAIWSQGCDFPTKGAVQKSRILQNHVAFVEPPLKGWVKKRFVDQWVLVLLTATPECPQEAKCSEWEEKDVSAKRWSRKAIRKRQEFSPGFFGKGVVGSPKNHLFEKENHLNQTSIFRFHVFCRV